MSPIITWLTLAIATRAHATLPATIGAGDRYHGTTALQVRSLPIELPEQAAPCLGNEQFDGDSCFWPPWRSPKEWVRDCLPVVPGGGVGFGPARRISHHCPLGSICVTVLQEPMGVGRIECLRISVHDPAWRRTGWRSTRVHTWWRWLRGRPDRIPDAARNQILPVYRAGDCA